MTAQTAIQGEPLTGREHIELVERWAAHNYHPLPIVVAKADGVWVEDADGKRYMDMLAAYLLYLGTILPPSVIPLLFVIHP